MIANYTAKEMPLDTVWLSYKYQDQHQDFTVNSKFGNFTELVAQIRTAGKSIVALVNGMVNANY